MGRLRTFRPMEIIISNAYQSLKVYVRGVIKKFSTLLCFGEIH